jgi:hypothetical protein
MPSSDPTPARRPWVVATAGAVALAVAMGIGRFAFTPLLPMMLAEGALDLRGASWLASANYLGYLAGALLCTFAPLLRRGMGWLPKPGTATLIRTGLVATGLLTVAMALPAPGSWPALRFAAGVASAVVFVYSSGWCLGVLARLGAPSTGGLMFVGPGAGIVVSGLFASAMVAGHWSAASAWLICGVLAFLLSASVWPIFDAPATAAPRVGDGAHPSGSAVRTAAPPSEIAWLALAYGLAGFGYIITATFLPVIARQALPDSSWLDFFWPIFGLGVIVGALLSTRLRVTGDLRVLLSGAYLIQAAAIALGIWSPSLLGFALGSFLLGVPFTAITFFAMQEVRRLRPLNTASTIGLLTATYGIGQIVGPPPVAALRRPARSVHEGFTLGLAIAAAGLLLGAAIYEGIRRAYPVRMPAHRPA